MERTRPHATATDATTEPVVAGEGFVRSSPEPEMRDLVNVRSTFSLPSGFTIAAPEGTYTIEKEIGRGGEGVSYLATTNDGTKKVLKVERERAGKDLEGKLRAELMRANKALGKNMRLLQLNPIDYAIVRDYAEGETIDAYLARTNRTFSERETLAMIEHVLREDLTPLHAENLVHRDIKPSNLIVSETADAKKAYELIDFGLLREDGADATITLNFKGSPGYSRFSADHSIQDDYYGLAETALFVLSGQHPKFIGTPELDKQYDSERIAKMPIAPGLKKLVLRMLGHNGTFETPQALLNQIVNVKKGFNGHADTSIDLLSANELTEYRKRATPPADLLAEIEGLKAIFKEQYGAALPERNPLSPEFRTRLESTLQRLGYSRYVHKDTAGNRVEEKHIFLRQRKDSTQIDALRFHHVGGHYFFAPVGQQYFDHFVVKDTPSLEELMGGYVKPSEDSFQDISTVFVLAEWAGLVGTGAYLGYHNSAGSLGAALFGGVVGVVAGLANFGISLKEDPNSTQDSKEPIPRLTSKDSVLWGVLPWKLYHLPAKIVYHAVDAAKRIGFSYRKRVATSADDDLDRLDNVLTPAPLFTYDEKPAQASTQPVPPAHSSRSGAMIV